MTTPQLEIIAIGAVCAVACAMPGTILVLRRMSLITDAISHSILLGIVVAFFAVKTLHSPVLIIAAAATGVLTVVLVELLTRTRLVKEDAAIGLVFPAMFAAAIILISRYAGDVHLDNDAVLLGELAFAPFHRFKIGSHDLAPRALVIMSVIALMNLIFVVVMWKEIKLSTFDPALAASMGFRPQLMHYLIMTLVSITVVGAFEAVGSIMVVALFIAPPAAAYLLTSRLSLLMFIACAIGVAGSTSGYFLARQVNGSIAGGITSMLGVLFLATFLFAPRRGLISLIVHRARQKWEFAERMLLIHLLHHEGLPEAAEENRLEHLSLHLGWDRERAANVVRRAQRHGYLSALGGHLMLTDEGRLVGRETLVA